VSTFILKLFLVALLILAACSGPRWEQKSGTQYCYSEKGGTGISRDFLMDGFDEDAPVRLYAYLLLPSSWHEDNKHEEYACRMAEAFWKGLVPIHPPADSVQGGITYWPLYKLSRQEIAQATVEQNWSVWVEYYHYQRARIIYSRIHEDDSRPLLVVALQPLGRLAADFSVEQKDVLLIDLSVLESDKLQAFMQAYQSEVMEKAGCRKDPWDMKALYSGLRPIFGADTETAVFLKSIEKGGVSHGHFPETVEE